SGRAHDADRAAPGGGGDCDDRVLVAQQHRAIVARRRFCMALGERHRYSSAGAVWAPVPRMVTVSALRAREISPGRGTLVPRMWDHLPSTPSRLLMNHCCAIERMLFVSQYSTRPAGKKKK